MKMKTSKKKFLFIILAVILAIFIAFAIYMAYLEFHYYRVDDSLELTVENNVEENLEKRRDYSILTYNIGFGAYSPKYTFFMDKGVMKDGKKVQGHKSRAFSLDDVVANTEGDIKVMQKLNPDFMILQEVDTDSTRSFHVNQKEEICGKFKDMSSVFTPNFHSPYLIYPFYEPHGSVEAGLLSMSKANIIKATRLNYPIDSSFFMKFTELDRCMLINRYKVTDGNDLVVINSHMSAYDKGGVYRRQQLKLLWDLIQEEYSKGNYVIVGGDFNHSVGDSLDIYKTEQKIPDWVYEIKDEDIPEGFSFIRADNYKDVPTCRTCDIPYEKGVNYTTVLDGFIISDNINAKAENIDLEFAYSDHNPVIMSFSLK